MPLQLEKKKIEDDNSVCDEDMRLNEIKLDDGEFRICFDVDSLWYA